jgi:thioredoxin-related protein
MSRFEYLFLLLILGTFSVSNCASKETATEEASSSKPVSSTEMTSRGATSTKIVWHDFDEGLRFAAKSNQPIYLFIKSKGCGWCRKMEQETFTDSEVKSALSKLVLVVLQGDSRSMVTYKGRSYSEAQLVQEVFGVRGFPTSIFMEPNGDIIGGLPGYLQPKQMVVITNYVGEGHYKNRSFEDYMKEAGS